MWRPTYASEASMRDAWVVGIGRGISGQRSRAGMARAHVRWRVLEYGLLQWGAAVTGGGQGVLRSRCCAYQRVA